MQAGNEHYMLHRWASVAPVVCACSVSQLAVGQQLISCSSQHLQPAQPPTWIARRSGAAAGPASASTPTARRRRLWPPGSGSPSWLSSSTRSAYTPAEGEVVAVEHICTMEIGARGEKKTLAPPTQPKGGFRAGAGSGKGHAAAQRLPVMTRAPAWQASASHVLMASCRSREEACRVEACRCS